ncbi:MAG TPA: hypothetical protein VK191_06445 [Symbiobacteriaceae bacterium]|nr:hypothetical protein [Symbiobacteriaceae bacterium]
MAASSFNPMAKLVVGLASVTAVAALAGTLSAHTQNQGTAGGTTALNTTPQENLLQQPRQSERYREEDEDDDDDHAAVVPRSEQQPRNQQFGRTGTLPRTRSKHS